MNRVALVTGSTPGNGREVARQLAARGLEVIVAGRGEVDIADERSVEAMGQRVEREFGRLDIDRVVMRRWHDSF